MSSAAADRLHGWGWRVLVIAGLVLALGAALVGSARVVARGEPGAGPELVPGDGCFYDPATGQTAFCEGDIVDTPPVDGGLIPGVDGCLYYPGGGLAECPGGASPAFGGCMPMADGSPGCVIPGPVAGVSPQPDPSLPPDVADEPGVVDGVAFEPAPEVSGIHPFLAAERVRVALAPVGAWLAALFGWILGG